MQDAWRSSGADLSKKKAAAASGVNTPKETPKRRGNPQNLMPAWQPGVTPNPKGRPKGSRNKLGEDFLSDMLTVWKEVGEDCIRRTAKEHPEKLVSIMAGILPKELNVNTNPVEELSDDELAAGIAFLKSVAAAAAGEGSDQETKH